jgi:norsolorinic acid ketoreductase
VATCRHPNAASSLQSLQRKGAEDRLVILPLEITSSESHKTVNSQLSTKGITSIDIVIANAGIYSEEYATGCSVETMRSNFETNVIGSMLTLQSCLELVLASQLKIFSVISSGMGSTGQAHQSGYGGYAAPYCVSKAALNMFAVNFASE